MNRKRGRKAEITASHIIVIVILIISFAIVYFFYTQLEWGGLVDKKVCHQSVIFKASVPDVGGQDVVKLPLQCRTDKICISDILFGQGECDAFKGEKYRTVRVTGDEEEKKEQIMQIYADALADCWSMMGEGKIDVFGRDTKATNWCTICARIVIDENLLKKFEEDKIYGFFGFLQNEKVPNKDFTYFEFLTASPSFEFREGDNKVKLQMEDIIELKNEYAVVFREWESGNWLDKVFALGGAVAASALGLYISGGTPAVGVIAGGAGGYAGAALGNYVGGVLYAANARNKNYLSSWGLLIYSTPGESILEGPAPDNGKTIPIFESGQPIDKRACVYKIRDDKKNPDRPEITEMGLTSDGLLIQRVPNAEWSYWSWPFSSKPVYITGLPNDKWFNQVEKELIIECRNKLNSFKCDSFEGFV